jgi:hypothetical protein
MVARVAPVISHRRCPPQHVPPRCRSVYGLVSGRSPAKSPSHAEAQWHRDLAQLTYRCGGSAGLDLCGLTGFPFHPLAVIGQRTPERRLSLPPI